MKFLVLALCIAAAVAAPVPDDNGDAVQLIVNGVPEGAALELGGIVDMHLNEHVDGQLASSTNLLHPLTAVGIAEAAAAAEVAAAEEIAPTPIQIAEPESDFHNIPEAIILPEPAEEVVPAPIVMPEPVIPVVVPEPIIMPEPVVPEVVPESIVMPQPVAPEVVPESIVMPEPVAPEVVPEAESIVLPGPSPPLVIPEVAEPVPEPAAQIPGEIFNNGLVQVQVNAPEDAGMFSTLQNWFSLVVNYISSGIQTSQQIV